MIPQQTILWLKYNGHPFDTSVTIRRDRSLWCWCQPGDYELWQMGKNNKWIITTDDQDKFDSGDFVLPKSREEVKIWLDVNHMKIGKRIGFSEPIYQVDNFMGYDYWHYLWVGYRLVEDR